MRTLLLLAVILAGGCATTTTTEGQPDGSRVERRQIRFLGLVVSDRQQMIASPADRVADAKADAKVEAILAPLRRLDRASLWATAVGFLLLLAAAAAVVLAYLLRGWKLFGGLAVVLGALGVVFVQMGLSVHRLIYLAVPAVAVPVLWFLWSHRNWSAGQWLAAKAKGQGDATIRT